MAVARTARTASAIGAISVISASVALLALAGSTRLEAQPPLVVAATNPPRLARNVAPTAAITIHFDRALMVSTVNASSFRAFARQSGPVSGAFTFTDGNATVSLRPSRNFAPGETVLVNLSHALRAADGGFLRSAGWAYQFSVAAGRATMQFDEIGILSVRDPGGAATRLYGGRATDLDRDGWLDLATMNEDSADVRVLLNTADGTGQFGAVLHPTNAVAAGASPNEVGDFNNDGFTDLITVDAAANKVSILLGSGNGFFAAQQQISIPSDAHGIGVLDVDGDGDLDLVTSDTTANELSLSLNNGSGVFGSVTNFEAGCDGEWTMTAGDMDEDGIADLIVGCANDQKIAILHGNGNGTFTFVSSRDAGGSPWKLTVGDVNGDGHLDVASGNGFSGNGSILLGNGDGTLQAAVTTSISGGAVSSDLADMDGDGDLDWVMSSYSGSDYELFSNDGTGTFTFVRSFGATSAGSCAVLFDSDNDGDLDMALFDEIADEIRLERNRGASGLLFADHFEEGDLSAWSSSLP